MKQLSLTGILFVAVLNCFSQSAPKSAIIEIPDLLYVNEAEAENDSLQRLNLVIPEGVENFPLLIWIGGGAWSYVDRNVEMDLARKFAAAGIGVAAVGHRLSPAIWRDSSLTTGIQHPKHIEDIAAAVKWLYDNAPKYQYDRTKIFIGGFSSGAQLAALLSFDNRYLEKVGLSTDLIKGIIPISGTYDIVNYYEVMKNSDRPEMADLHVKAVFGENNSDFIDASPITYLDSLSIPMLVMVDRYLINYTKIFEEKLMETSFGDFQVLYIHNLTHGELWRNISRKENSIYRDMIIEFITSHTQS
ncbi:MAG: alpha/beta hydrolase [Bacteroidia bacterium]